MSSTTAEDVVLPVNSSSEPESLQEHHLPPVVQNVPKPKLSKEITSMMKTLNVLSTPEEKIAALCKKYSDISQKYQISQKQLEMSKKKEMQLQNEVARGHNDKTKMTMAISRLENLSRELQKRNAAEEKKVQQMADKLKTSLTDAEVQMKKALENNDRLSSDYLKIKKEFEAFSEKNKKRDGKIESVFEQYQLELKLLTCEHNKLQLEMERDMEKVRYDKQLACKKLKEQTAAFEVQHKLVASLQDQVKFYESKFGEFQSMLKKSHDTCESLAAQHDKMKKRLSSMESERVTLRHKLEQKSKQATDAIKKNEKHANKQGKLERLCRALQNERNDLVHQLKQLELQISSTNTTTTNSTTPAHVNSPSPKTLINASRKAQASPVEMQETLAAEEDKKQVELEVGKSTPVVEKETFTAEEEPTQVAAMPNEEKCSPTVSTEVITKFVQVEAKQAQLEADRAQLETEQAQVEAKLAKLEAERAAQREAKSVQVEAEEQAKVKTELANVKSVETPLAETEAKPAETEPQSAETESQPTEIEAQPAKNEAQPAETEVAEKKAEDVPFKPLYLFKKQPKEAEAETSSNNVAAVTPECSDNQKGDGPINEWKT